jgi:predicted MPP superfamily phosphohydrolase
MYYILIFIVLLLLFGLYIVYENKNLEVTEYKVVSPKLPNAFHGMKIVMLTDLHSNTYGNTNEILIRRIQEKSPDLILVAGDMIVGRESEDMDTAYQLLHRLSKSYPIYYGIGNHEQRLILNHSRAYEEYQNKLKSEGIIFLENRSITLKKENQILSITGVMIGKEYFKKLKQPIMTKEYLQNLVGFPNNQWYNILIAHNPSFFSTYASWGADLTVSGHNHGGIIRLPGLGGVVSPQYKLFPKYDAGRFEKDNKVMLVSRGLGLHTIKVRILNRPELMVITLKNKD